MIFHFYQLLIRVCLKNNPTFFKFSLHLYRLLNFYPLYKLLHFLHIFISVWIFLKRFRISVFPCKKFCLLVFFQQTLLFSIFLFPFINICLLIFFDTNSAISYFRLSFLQISGSCYFFHQISYFRLSFYKCLAFAIFSKKLCNFLFSFFFL